MLDQEKINLNNFLKRECPSQTFINYIGCYFDYQNLENFYKNNIFDLSIDEKSIIEGNIPITKIRESVKKNDFKSIENGFVKELFENIEIVKNKAKDFSKIDFYFKSYLYKNLLKIANDDKILLKLLKYDIDLQNLILAIRASNFEEVKSQFIENGNLDINIFKIYINENKFSVTLNDRIFDSWATILKRVSLEEKLKLFEKEKELLKLKVLSGYENDIESIIPFLKYYYKKLLEINNMRMIFSLKLNNLDSYIKERFLEENKWIHKSQLWVI